jgi:3-methyladenine DNA glycosylase AlkD
MELDEVLSELKKNSNEHDREGMARFGINPKYTLGVRIPILRKIARKSGKNHGLALGLWKTRIHEARILASMVEDPSRVSEKQMDSWIRDFDSWDVCDQCCMNLFYKLPFAYEKAIGLTNEKKEFVKRAGFTLMAVFAVHSDFDDSKFEKFFPIIKRNSTDERNFVKKAVNWALRQIGKRNNRLRKRGIGAAKDILQEYPDSKSAKWIAQDAIRELSSKPFLMSSD